MARVAGVDLPKNKRIDVALRYLHGVGQVPRERGYAKLSGVVKPESPGQGPDRAARSV